MEIRLPVFRGRAEFIDQDAEIPMALAEIEMFQVLRAPCHGDCIGGLRIHFRIRADQPGLLASDRTGQVDAFGWYRGRIDADELKVGRRRPADRALCGGNGINLPEAINL